MRVYMQSVYIYITQLQNIKFTWDIITVSEYFSGHRGPGEAFSWPSLVNDEQ